MKSKRVIIFLSLLLFFLTARSVAFAEDKMDFSQPDGGGIIPKIEKTANDPILRDGGVYPMWGPVCQRYTYHTTYQDKEGRPPKYVRMFFNGKWIDVEKGNPNDNDYKKGVRYIYKFVPNKLGSNFFFFEASNGLGKAREGIIDSPGNGPVLFEGDFLDNEISLMDSKTGEKVWKFPTGKEWVGGVALSDDGKYLAAQTTSHIYLFDTKSNKPLWDFGSGVAGTVGGDVKGGVAISSDGNRIFASLGNNVFLFEKDSKKPIWQGQSGSNTPYNVAISADGKYMAVATAGDETNLESNLLILWNEKSGTPLWQYHASGNFHDVSLSADGSFLAGATGCPDRRAYIFSKSSNKPLVKSEMLTYDSPVNTSEISANGEVAYFSTDGGPQSSVLALFSKNSNSPIWKFDDGINRAARAMRITPNGEFATVTSMKGDVYLLERGSNTPIKSFKIEASTAALDIPDDASFIAVGGTDNKVHILSISANGQKEVLFDEYVQDISVSGNGQYIAAGTGGSAYFFESFAEENKIFPCDKIIEPLPLDQALKGMGQGQKDTSLGEGNTSASLKETFIATAIKNTFVKIGLIGFFVSLLLLGVYLLVIKFNLLKKYRERLLTRRKIILVALLSLAGTFVILTIVSALFAGKSASKTNDADDNVCGNSICEPNFGESKETCPKDCAPSE